MYPFQKEKDANYPCYEDKATITPEEGQVIISVGERLIENGLFFCK